MTTTKKLVIAVVALSLVLACTLGGTLAWLVAESGTVTNTFTYGEIKIELEETKGTGTDVREFGKIVPGATVEKDPTVTVLAGSENCYVYAKVENNVVLNDSVIVTCNINTDNWEAIGTKTNANGSTVTLYKYKTSVPASDENTKLPALFKTVTFGDYTSADVPTLDGIENDIVITAYAHQADIITEAEADDVAIAWADVTAIS